MLKTSPLLPLNKSEARQELLPIILDKTGNETNKILTKIKMYQLIRPGGLLFNRDGRAEPQKGFLVSS